MPTFHFSKAKARDAKDTPYGSVICQRITAQIVELLRRGVRPWIAPWDSGTALGLPLRSNGVAYRGINTLALWAAAQTYGYRARHWLSFKQALALGGAVRRGEHGQPIIFYSSGATHEVGDAEPTPQPRRSVLRIFTVFNADQVGGLPVHFYAPPISPPSEDDAALAARFEHIPANIERGGARACYNPARDVISMPPRHAFGSTALYYATLAHECAHWTGHPTRLDRDLTSRVSGASYAFEELVAELAAAFLSAELGLPAGHLENHAAYIDSWLKLLVHEPNALLSAAGKAQAAADYLRGFVMSVDYVT